LLSERLNDLPLVALQATPEGKPSLTSSLCHSLAQTSMAPAKPPLAPPARDLAPNPNRAPVQQAVLDMHTQAGPCLDEAAAGLALLAAGAPTDSREGVAYKRYIREIQPCMHVKLTFLFQKTALSSSRVIPSVLVFLSPPAVSTAVSILHYCVVPD